MHARFKAHAPASASRDRSLGPPGDSEKAASVKGVYDLVVGSSLLAKLGGHFGYLRGAWFDQAAGECECVEGEVAALGGDPFFVLLCAAAMALRVASGPCALVRLLARRRAYMSLGEYLRRIGARPATAYSGRVAQRSMGCNARVRACTWRHRRASHG
jgi:hypothetical protein